MDITLRDAERLFQQEMTIPSLANVMRIKLRGGLYQDTNVLRADNKTYQKLLGLSLVDILEKRQVSTNSDGSLYSGAVTGLDRSQIPPDRWWSNEEVKFDVNLDNNSCVWSVNLLLPEHIVYDLLSPVGDGMLALIVYGVATKGSEPIKNTYQPGDLPFKDGRAMCQHMVDTWGKKASGWKTTDRIDNTPTNF